ncbi:MAG: phytoene desaturase [Bacteroidetes bacterium]|nr:phytoene desaturase [Bacteroidota bacterium]
MKQKSKKVCIVGSGIAGLACAARLAAKGYAVACFEANSYYGGKLTSFEKDGFRFDAGPSLFTMPQLVDDVFVAANKNPRTYFNYKQKEVACNYFFSDGLLLTGYADITKFAHEIENKLGVNKNVIINYFNKSKMKYQRVGNLFMTHSLHKLSTWLSSKVLVALSHIYSFDLLNTMNGVNVRELKNDKLIQLFNRYATYNGSNPYSAPGLLTLIPHLEHGIGTFIPEGGMQQIPESLYKLCIDLGVTFHFNSPVDKIILNGSRASGVISKQQHFDFDMVVCNSDIANAYKKLIPELKKSKTIATQERSSSALIFYWGINKRFSQLDLHNILFSSNYKEEFDCMFAKQEVYQDPTVYINISSKEITGDAPVGAENWFVMINMPANKGYYTDEVQRKARAFIIKKINTLLSTDIEKYIIVEDVLTPVSIESKTGSLHGSLYGTASNTKMSAFSRHANFSTEVNNLFFCGGSVHPGGGIPLCLNSAKIVSELIADVN